jgi:ABC-2 type transport system ATP-binding protein
MKLAVRTDALTKRYGRSTAVSGLSLSIDEGEIFGLVGPNGAGKTTTLKMLATLLPPSAGDAEISGISVRQEPDAVRRVIGYMPDTFGVYDDMRVWEYLDFFGRCYGLSASRRRQMIGDLLELVDLGAKRNSYVQHLSRGMQQRLCLAHALVHDPQVLLLDEPASGLDPRARVELRELLRELRSLGKTIVISSHILPELEELCTSLAIIDHGRVMASGRVDDIAQRFRVGGVYRVRVIGDADEVESARAFLAGLPGVASVAAREDGLLEIGATGDDIAVAGLLSALVQSGRRVVSFAPAASDLEELFLQITDESVAGPPKEAAA